MGADSSTLTCDLRVGYEWDNWEGKLDASTARPCDGIATHEYVMSVCVARIRLCDLCANRVRAIAHQLLGKLEVLA